ncbi:MAG: hypothetical protein Gyms2KO_09920 [Gymnodinialimonas sp.]
MDRPNTARVARAPSLEQIKGFGAAHLSYWDPVGPKPERRAHKV